MHAAVLTKRDTIAELCRRFRVRRLEVFGSAARAQDFDTQRSDADLLVEFEPGAEPDFGGFLDLKDALEQALGRPVDLVDRRSIASKAATTCAAAASCRKRSRSLWRDEALLLDMLLAAGDALSFVKGLDRAQFDASELHQSAVARCIGIIGEAARKVSREFCDVHPQIPWREIIGMRHRLIQNYTDLRLDKVWTVLQDELPGLITALRPLIPPPDADP